MFSSIEKIRTCINNKQLTIGLSIAYILFYFTLVFNYSHNIPFQDDYPFINFLDAFHHSKSFNQTLALLFQKHNEHNMLFLKSIILLYDFIIGGINFKFLIIVGNLLLLPLLYVSYNLLVKYNRFNAIYFFACTLLIFNTTSLDNMFWAMACISNFGCVSLMMLSLYFYSTQENSKQILSVLVALLAFNSSALGILVIPGFIYLTYFNKSYKILFVTIALIAINYFLYHIYAVPGAKNSILEKILEISTEIFLFFIYNIASPITNPLNTIFTYYIPVSFIILIYLAITYFLFIKKAAYISKLPDLVFILISLSSVFLLTIGRGSSAMNAFECRYVIIATPFLLFFIILVNDNKAWNHLFVLFLIFCGVEKIPTSLKYYEDHSYRLKLSAYFFSKGDNLSTFYGPTARAYFGEKFEPGAILKTIAGSKVYEIPDTTIQIKKLNYVNKDIPYPETNDNRFLGRLSVDETQKFYICSGLCFIQQMKQFDTKGYLVIKNAQKTNIIELEKAYFFQEKLDPRYRGSNFFMLIDKQKMKMDLGELYFLVLTSDLKKCLYFRKMKM